MFTGCNNPDIEQHPDQQQVRNGDGTGENTPSFRGKLQAKQDVADAKLEYKTYGLPTKWAHHFYQILETDYKIKVDFMAGCMVSEDISNYADAYNDIMESEIKRRHGDDIFDRVQAIAIGKQKLEESSDNAMLRSR